MHFTLSDGAVCDMYTKGVAHTCLFSHKHQGEITLRPLTTNRKWLPTMFLYDLNTYQHGRYSQMFIGVRRTLY